MGARHNSHCFKFIDEETLMARNTVHCTMCGKAFFPNSLPIHMKQCALKMALVPIPCLYCREPYPHGEMPSHVARCKEAKKANRQREIIQASAPQKSVNIKDTVREGASSAAHEGFGPTKCAVCGRNFSMDRIAVHQNICEKLANKARTRPRKIFPAKKGRVIPEVCFRFL